MKILPTEEEKQSIVNYTDFATPVFAMSSPFEVGAVFLAIDLLISLERVDMSHLGRFFAAFALLFARFSYE